MKRILSVVLTLVMCLSLVASLSVTVSAAKTNMCPIVNMNSNYYLSSVNNTFYVKGNKTIQFKLGYYDSGTITYNADYIAPIMKENAEFSYTIYNKKGNVIATGKAGVGTSVKIKNNAFSTCTIKIVSKVKNDGKYFGKKNGKQYAKRTDSRIEAKCARYYLEY